MIERKAFFNTIRRGPFPGALGPGQVEGISLVLDEWERRGLTDLRQLAYMLATDFWETARTMQPIREYGFGKGKKYGQPVNGHVYYGRGLVQLTWDYNYRKMGELLKIDLLNRPDLALDPRIAVQIMFEGMIRGTFTSKKLADYFGAGVTDWNGARRIINGTDRALEIAKIARQFYAALFTTRTGDLPQPGKMPSKPARSWVDILLSPFKRKG